jgi:hypothetical protein
MLQPPPRKNDAPICCLRTSSYSSSSSSSSHPCCCCHTNASSMPSTAGLPSQVHWHSHHADQLLLIRSLRYRSPPDSAAGGSSAGERRGAGCCVAHWHMHCVNLVCQTGSVRCDGVLMRAKADEEAACHRYLSRHACGHLPSIPPLLPIRVSAGWRHWHVGCCCCCCRTVWHAAVFLTMFMEEGGEGAGSASVDWKTELELGAGGCAEHVTRHTSYVTSHLTPHTSHLTRHARAGLRLCIVASAVVATDLECVAAAAAF